MKGSYKYDENDENHDDLMLFARVGMENAPKKITTDTPPLLPSPLPEFMGNVLTISDRRKKDHVVLLSSESGEERTRTTRRRQGTTSGGRSVPNRTSSAPVQSGRDNYDSDSSSSSEGVPSPPDSFSNDGYRSRSLSAKRHQRFGQRTPSLDIGIFEDHEGSDSNIGCYSYFGPSEAFQEDTVVESKSKTPPSRKTSDQRTALLRRDNRTNSDDSSYYVLSSSGTLHVPGFLVKASGLSPAGRHESSSSSSSSLGEKQGKSATRKKTTRREKPTMQGAINRRRSSTGDVQTKKMGIPKSSIEQKRLLALAASNRSYISRSSVEEELVTLDEDDDGLDDGGEAILAMERFFNQEELVFIKRLGKGASGTVNLALHVNVLRLIAVKSVPVFDDQKRAQLVSELRALFETNLLPLHRIENDDGDDLADDSLHGAKQHGDRLHRNCPYIVSMFDAFVRKEDSTINLALEWMDGGSVQDVIDVKGKLSEPEIASILHCILRGLGHIHGRRQLHRDIKPSNLLLSRTTGLAKLSDFGISHSFGSFSAANTFVGSLSYMAPERISSDDDGYSYPADVWSVGLSILVCATGSYPFQLEYDEQGYWGLVHAISENPSPKLDRGEHSPELCDLVNRCLKKSPSERPSVFELLHHPFLTERYPFRQVVGTEFCQGIIHSKERWGQLDEMIDHIVDYYHTKCSKLQHTQPRFSYQKLLNLAIQIGLAKSNDELSQSKIHPELEKRLQKLNNMLKINKNSNGQSLFATGTHDYHFS